MPPTGIDVFDVAGARVAAFDTPGTMSAGISWSPDGTAIGWHSGECIDSSCSNHEFNWRLLTDQADVTTITSEFNIGVKWAPDNRLRVTTFDDDGGLKEVYSAAPDGSDVITYEWDSSGPAWSPDGQLLAGMNYESNQLIVRAAEGGEATAIDLPAGAGFAAWSPDSHQIALYGEDTSGGSGYGFYVVNVDGSGEVQFLADGEDFAWMPASIGSQRE
jgi:Tol biopolymer transport system component